jgi:hypothetical protein
MTMKNVLTRMFPMVLAASLVAAPVTAFAQAQPPTRVGNVWNWQDHQPTETQVQREERATGIAPTPAQRSSDAAALDEIYRQLLR